MNDFAIDVTLVQNDAKLNYNDIARSSQNVISDCSKLGQLSNGAKPFILGASPLSIDGDVFWNANVKYDGFFSGSLTSETGASLPNSQSVFRLYAGGAIITSVIIFFDKTAGQWAEELLIDGELYKNNKYYAAFMLEPKSEHIISITKWNKPYYPVRITAIVTGYAESYDDARIRSVKWTKAILDDNAKPFLGLTSAYGEIELADRDSIVENLAALSVIDRMSECTISNGQTARTDEKAQNTEFAYLTDRYKMNFGDNFFQVSLTDAIEKLRGVHYVGYPLSNAKATADTVFQSLKACAESNGVKMLCRIDYLNSIIIKYAYLPSGSLYDAVKEFCILIGGTAYTNNANAIVIERIDDISASALPNTRRQNG